MDKKKDSFGSSVMRSKIFLLVLLVVFAFSAWSLINEYGRRQKIEAEITKQKEAIQKLEDKNKDLSGLIDYLRSPDYVEKEARDKLTLSKPGESLIIIEEDDQNVTSENNQLSYSAKWWNYFFK